MFRLQAPTSNPAHLHFVRSRGCHCGWSGRCSGPVEAHHVATGAIGLCARHRDELLATDPHSFEAKHAVDLAREAAYLALIGDIEADVIAAERSFRREAA